MTANAQDFTVTSADDEVVTFCVVGPDGAALNLSSVTNVEWTTWFDANNLLTKTLLDGGVVLENDGVTGLVAVTLEGVDTAPWLGQYNHQLVLIDDVGKRSTVANGVMTVAPRVVPL